MPIRQGDIYWVSIYPPGTVGSEQSGRRPYVIVSRNALNGDRTVVGVPLTSKLRKACAHRIQVPESQILPEPGSTYKPVDSVALTDHVRVLDVSRLEGACIARLTQTARIAVIETGLAYVFDITF